MAKQGKQFEQAVYLFIKENMPGASVYFDHRIPDRDTGRLRQVDAWIEGLWGFLPVKVLVSCKDRGRSLNVGFVEQFAGEVTSTAANFGVLFSSSGLSPAAIEKAGKQGVLCASLFSGGLAPNVESLLFQAYAGELDPRLKINVFPANIALLTNRYKLASDLALTQLEIDGKKITALSRLLDLWGEAEPKNNLHCSPTAPPSDWSCVLNISDEDDYPDNPCKWCLECEGKWKFYKATLSANELKGYRIHNTPRHSIVQSVSFVAPVSRDPKWTSISRTAMPKHKGVYVWLPCRRVVDDSSWTFTDDVKGQPLELADVCAHIHSTT